MIHKERLAVPCMYQRERKCDCPCHKHFYETDKQYESRLKRESYCFCRRTLLEMTEKVYVAHKPMYNIPDRDF